MSDIVDSVIDPLAACDNLARTARYWREWDAKKWANQGEEPKPDSAIIGPPSWPTHKQLLWWERGLLAVADEITRLRAENAEKETMLLNQAKTIKEMQAEIEALREALKPFADMCDEIESCAAEYPADHPASNPNEWFTGFEWGDLLRARSAYEGEK